MNPGCFKGKLRSTENHSMRLECKNPKSLTRNLQDQRSKAQVLCRQGQAGFWPSQLHFHPKEGRRSPSARSVAPGWAVCHQGCSTISKGMNSQWGWNTAEVATLGFSFPSRRMKVWAVPVTRRDVQRNSALGCAQGWEGKSSEEQQYWSNGP